MEKTKKKGFTLMELIAVIAIVIVLSLISTPIYNSYVFKSRQAEGYALLGVIRTAQERYRGEYGTFLSDKATAGKGATCYEKILDINARTNLYYTLFNVGAWVSNDPYNFTAIVHAKDLPAISMCYSATVGIVIK